MINRRSLLTRVAAGAIGILISSSTAWAQQPSLPFKIFDSHTHFVSADQQKYPIRKDLPPLQHEQEMREYQMQNPTTSQRVFGLWDANGVEAGVAVQYRSTYNLDNSYVVDTAAAYPERVRGVVILDPSDEATPATLRRWVKEKGISGIRTIGGKNAGGEYPLLDSPAALRTWTVANELGIAVVLMTTPVYRADAGALERIAANESLPAAFASTTSARTIATRALMSGVKPRRIIAQSRIGSVFCVPVTRMVIIVSSNDSAKARMAPPIMALERFGRTMRQKVCQRVAPRS